MDCAIDNSAVSWLAKLGYLHLLKTLYENIYAPPGVYRQCKDNKYFIEIKENILQPIKLEKFNLKRFYKLARRWYRKLKLDDIVDAEVFIAHNFYDYGDEMLFANKDAEYKLGKYGNIRDIMFLYRLAEDYKIFNRNDSIKYLNSLIEIGFRTKIIKEHLRCL